MTLTITTIKTGKQKRYKSLQSIPQYSMRVIVQTMHDCDMDSYADRTHRYEFKQDDKKNPLALVSDEC